MADERTGPKSREQTERKPQEFSYRPPSNLPDPNPRDGWHHRWVRHQILNEADPRSVSMRLREGWETCLPEDYPEIIMGIGQNANTEGNIEIGGLLLMRISEEAIKARQNYYRKQNEAQIQSVDNNFMREQDPRMPLLPTERRTEVTFGRGRS
jgi:hypothetical protein